MQFKYLKLKTKLLVGVVSVLGVCGLPSMVQGTGISKCQDENGEWHYGDFAVAECAANSDITKMNNSGTEVGVVKPPPTAEELQAQQEKKQTAVRLAKDKKKQQELDQNLVLIYVSEESIVSTRDRKMTSINTNLEVTRQLKQGVLKDIGALKKRKQSKRNDKMILEREVAIQSYDNVIEQGLFERKKLEQKYGEILQNFQAASTRLAAGG